MLFNSRKDPLKLECSLDVFRRLPPDWGESPFFILIFSLAESPPAMDARYPCCAFRRIPAILRGHVAHRLGVDPAAHFGTLRRTCICRRCQREECHTTDSRRLQTSGDLAGAFSLTRRRTTPFLWLPRQPQLSFPRGSLATAVVFPHRNCRTAPLAPI